MQPHRSETFKLSRDPLFDKVRDITGLYLSPPDRALVLCVEARRWTAASRSWQALALRARIVLAAADGLSDKEIAALLEVTELLQRGVHTSTRQLEADSPSASGAADASPKPPPRRSA